MKDNPVPHRRNRLRHSIAVSGILNLQHRILLLVLAGTVGLSADAQAHICNTPRSGRIVVAKGEIANYSILADVAESAPTSYQVISISNTNVVRALNPSFDALRIGRFKFEALNAGTATITMRWTYAPNVASGLCSVTIEVVTAGQDPRDSSENSEYAWRLSDPVDAFTGELVLNEVPDIYLDGPMPLYFARYYASALSQNGPAATLGRNWSHNFNWYVTRDNDRAEVITDRGRRITFQNTGNAWQLTGRASIPFQLAEQVTNYVFADPHTRYLYTFTPAGQLIAIADGKGNELTISYDGPVPLQVSDGLGRVLTIAYRQFQELAGISDGTRVIGFAYSFEGDLLRVTNVAGGVTTYAYDNAKADGSLLTSVVRPRGNTPYVQTYDTQGRVLTQTAGAASVYRFNYGPASTTVTNPLGLVETFVHSTNGLLLSITDATNQTLRFGYNSDGQRTTLTNREGAVLRITLHTPSGQPATLEHADGRTVTFTYAARTNPVGIVLYDLVTATFPDGTRDQYAHESNGLLLQWTDRAGRMTRYAYSGRGQLLSVTNPAGGVIRYTYNPDGTLATALDPAGNTTTFGYDALKRRNLITRPDLTTLSFQFNAMDQATQVKDERDQVTLYTNNANGRVVAVVDPLGNTNRFSYGVLDQPVGFTDPTGNSVWLGYDGLGRMNAITNRNGYITRLTYDAQGRMTSATDPDGFTAIYAYDNEGRVTSITDALGHTAQFGHAPDGRVNQITTPLGNSYWWTYNPLGRESTLEEPVGDLETRSYDHTDLVMAQWRGGATSAAYLRDAAGLMNCVMDGRRNAWVYPRTTGGLPMKVRDPLGREINYTYDGRNRVRTMTFPGALGSLTLSYNGLDRISRLEYSDGKDLAFAYNAVGLLTNANGISMAHNAARQMTNCNGLAIGRDPGGRITSITFAPGRTVVYEYNGRDLLTKVTDWVGGTTTFDYDAAGRLTRVSRPNGVPTTNAYGADNLITNIQEGAVAGIALTRDANGRVIRASRNLPPTPTLTPGETALTYDSASQIGTAAYDALGRLLTEGSRTFSWDASSRLTNLVSGGTTIAGTYDALNYRLTHTEGGITSGCVWNYATTIPTMVVVRQGATDVRYFVYSPEGMLLFSIEATTGARRFYHFDESGNTLFLTDDSGTVVATYAYSPYGELLGAAGLVPNPFTWQGRFGAFREANTGLYSLRQRFYDSLTGRFISPDPIHALNPRRINPYQYAAGDPLLYIDPLGLDPIGDWLAWTKAASTFFVLFFAIGFSDFDSDFDEKPLEGKGFSLRVSYNSSSLLSPYEKDDARSLDAGSKALRLSYGLNFNLDLGYAKEFVYSDPVRDLEGAAAGIRLAQPNAETQLRGYSWDNTNPSWLIQGAYFQSGVEGLAATGYTPDYFRRGPRSGFFDILQLFQRVFVGALCGPPPRLHSPIPYGGF